MEEKLFEKYVLNNKVEVPSRLAVAPLTLFSSNEDGSINDEEREYLKMRGTGIGLYILGATVVSQEGITGHCQPRSLSEKDLPSLEERAKIIKISRSSCYKPNSSWRSPCSKRVNWSRSSSTFC